MAMWWTFFIIQSNHLQQFLNFSSTFPDSELERHHDFNDLPLVKLFQRLLEASPSFELRFRHDIITYQICWTIVSISWNFPSVFIIIWTLPRHWFQSSLRGYSPFVSSKLILLWTFPDVELWCAVTTLSVWPSVELFFRTYLTISIAFIWTFYNFGYGFQAVRRPTPDYTFLSSEPIF